MSGPPPRPVAAMDPLHITEFASDRYFAKITQEREQQQNKQQQQLLLLQPQQQYLHHDGLAVAGSSRVAVLPPPAPISSEQFNFILPIRESKIAEPKPSQAQPEQKLKKSRFGGFSRLLHSKSQVPEAVAAAAPIVLGPHEHRKISIISAGEFIKPKTVPFDELFLSLPTELQIQVIASLPLSDILNLRLASKALHAMVTIHEGPIVRAHLEQNVPAYAKRLYAPDYSNLTLHYLCGLWHRLHVAAKISFFICGWVEKEIFLRTSQAQKDEFAPQKERMRRRLIPLLFTIFHFFETYRARHVQYLLDNDGRGLQYTPYTINPIELEVMNMYDDRTLLQVHQVFPLVVASFCRRLRPPSYAGRVERSIRGYLRDKPADEVHVAALCIGGLRQVERFWEIKSYNTRRGEVDTWYNAITKEPVEAVQKKGRGLIGLGRKKSSSGLRDTGMSGDGSIPPVPAIPARWSTESAGKEPVYHSVFNTSLSQGMPMGPLDRDSLRLLLPDLPALQKLWLSTAEALILDRKIVERPIDIKRNASVMLELIREDGVIEDDQWWYGEGAHASVRPPLDSIEEDVEEGGLP